MLVDIINGTQGTRKQIKVLPNLLRMQKEVEKYSSTNHRQTFLEREFEVFQSDRRGRSVVFFVRVLDPSSTDEGVPSIGRWRRPTGTNGAVADDTAPHLRRCRDGLTTRLRCIRR